MSGANDVRLYSSVAAWSEALGGFCGVRGARCAQCWCRCWGGVVEVVCCGAEMLLRTFFEVKKSRIF